MKNVIIRFLVGLLAFQGFVTAQLLMIEPAHASVAPDVVINEVMWMGSTAQDRDEWIELYSQNGYTVGTGDLTLAVSSGATTRLDITIPEGTEFLPNSTLLIANTPSATARTVTPDITVGTANFWISNDCSIANIVLTDESDLEMDSVGCDGIDYFFPSAPSIKHALERKIDVYATDVSGWFARNNQSEGFSNLDSVAVTAGTLGTPGTPNDVTPADETAAVANDGLAADINWSDSLTEASANWDGFADPESGLSGEYNVELLDSTDTVIDSAAVTSMSHTFRLLSLSEGEMYHFAVSAINGVNLASLAAESDGFTVDKAIPEPASNPTVTDVASDNGGSVVVQWDASTSLDEITYRVDYNKVGEVTVLSQNAGSLLETTISGLENNPSVYEFEIVAIDFSDRESLVNPTAQGSALDNLAPILDVTKLTVSQNKPGTNDTVAGAAGTSSEAATVTVFDRHPTDDPMAVVLASVQTGIGFGFDAISIGDNRYATVWLQLVDAGGNASEVKSLSNDIVGPAAPTITKGKVTCKTISCRVELTWVGMPDSTEYVVEYGSGVNLTRTAPISNTMLILDLPADGCHYSFVVYALDQFGNISGQSNSFLASLVAGVVTSGQLINGNLAVTTAALEGSKETIQSTVPTTSAKLVPTAQAANDVTVDVAGQQDWLRIAIVVVLLLIVAAGFYSLSRSMQRGPLDVPALPVVAKKTKGKRKKRGETRR